VTRTPRIALALTLAILIVGADWALFHRDWMPLFWHLRHGRHAELNGVRFTVPLLYQEDHGASTDMVEFYQFPGRFSKKTAAITIQFNKSSSIPAFDSTFVVRERTASLAEKRGNCVEYVSPRYITVGEFSMLSNSAPTYIYCDFGNGWRANFSGSLDAKYDFYAFLADAKLLSRRN